MKYFFLAAVLFSNLVLADWNLDGIVTLKGHQAYTFVATDNNANNICKDLGYDQFSSYSSEVFTMKGMNGTNSLKAFKTTPNIANTILIQSIYYGRLSIKLDPVLNEDGVARGNVLSQLVCK